MMKCSKVNKKTSQKGAEEDWIEEWKNEESF